MIMMETLSCMTCPRTKTSKTIVYERSLLARRIGSFHPTGTLIVVGHKKFFKTSIPGVPYLPRLRKFLL